MLDDLRTNEDVRALHPTTTFRTTATRDKYRRRAPARRVLGLSMSVRFVNTLVKPKFDHHVSECPYLPERNKRFWARVGAMTDYVVEDPKYGEFDYEELDTWH